MLPQLNICRRGRIPFVIVERSVIMLISINGRSVRGRKRDTQRESRKTLLGGVIVIDSLQRGNHPPPTCRMFRERRGKKTRRLFHEERKVSVFVLQIALFKTERRTGRERGVCHDSLCGEEEERSPSVLSWSCDRRKARVKKELCSHKRKKKSRSALLGTIILLQRGFKSELPGPLVW